MNHELSKLKGKLLKNHPLAEYTSWKIGGPAEYFYQPQDLEDLTLILKTWNKTPVTILGAGSNVLIRDQGIDGLVISLQNNLVQWELVEEHKLLRVEAGVNLPYFAKQCSEQGIIDIAFLAGIPGTIGGALRMNAGAYGDNIWNYIKKVETISQAGEVKLRDICEFEPSYRTVLGLQPDEWFVAAYFSFKQDDPEAAKNQIQSYLEKRRNSQPLNLPSCGSVFRNPENNFAAKLIEECRLKGEKIGDAQVSEKHANFIINLGNATATEVEKLIETIIIEVEKQKGIKLHPEVHILGKSV